MVDNARRINREVDIQLSHVIRPSLSELRSSAVRPWQIRLAYRHPVSVGAFRRFSPRPDSWRWLARARAAALGPVLTAISDHRGAQAAPASFGFLAAKTLVNRAGDRMPMVLRLPHCAAVRSMASTT